MLNLLEGVQENYVNGEPRHLSAPATSDFREVPYETLRFNPQGITDILSRNQCALVTGLPQGEDFSLEEALLTLASPDHRVQMQGQSVSLKPLLTLIWFQTIDLSKPLTSGTGRLVYGTIDDLLRATNAGHGGKILNGLSFPSGTPYLTDAEMPFASDRFAWSNTANTIFKAEAPSPTSDLNWGLAATAGAHSLFHLDVNGLATTVRVLVGSKLWFIGTSHPHNFENIGWLTSGTFDLGSRPQDFKLEMILILEGQMLCVLSRLKRCNVN